MSKLIHTPQSAKPSHTRDRFFRIEDKWYFAVRQGPDQGPFDSKNEAQTALQKFLSRVKNQQRYARTPVDQTSVFIN